MCDAFLCQSGSFPPSFIWRRRCTATHHARFIIMYDDHVFVHPSQAHPPAHDAGNAHDRPLSARTRPQTPRRPGTSHWPEMDLTSDLQSHHRASSTAFRRFREREGAAAFAHGPRWNAAAEGTGASFLPAPPSETNLRPIFGGESAFCDFGRMIGRAAPPASHGIGPTPPERNDDDDVIVHEASSSGGRDTARPPRRPPMVAIRRPVSARNPESASTPGREVKVKSTVEVVAKDAQGHGMRAAPLAPQVHTFNMERSVGRENHRGTYFTVGASQVSAASSLPSGQSDNGIDPADGASCRGGSPFGRSGGGRRMPHHTRPHSSKGGRGHVAEEARCFNKESADAAGWSSSRYAAVGRQWREPFRVKGAVAFDVQVGRRTVTDVGRVDVAARDGRWAGTMGFGAADAEAAPPHGKASTDVGMDFELGRLSGHRRTSQCGVRFALDRVNLAPPGSPRYTSVSAPGKSPRPGSTFFVPRSARGADYSAALSGSVGCSLATTERTSLYVHRHVPSPRMSSSHRLL